MVSEDFSSSVIPLITPDKVSTSQKDTSDKVVVKDNIKQINSEQKSVVPNFNDQISDKN